MLYLILFYDEWPDFRIHEFISLVSYYEIPILNNIEVNESCFLLLEISQGFDEKLMKIASETVLINRIIQIISYNKTFPLFLTDLNSNSCCYTDICRDNDRNLSWSLKIETFGKKMTSNEKETCREEILEVLDLPGDVKLVDPDIELLLIFDCSIYLPRKGKAVIIDHDNECWLKLPVYFGKHVCKGGMRDEMNKYDLKKRVYIGPTSLDHSLGFIMTNLARIRKGSIVFDPFVGTGSILIGASHFGAFCFGTDIDIRVLNGETYAGKGDKTVKRGIFDNFDDYELKRPELIRMDNHLIDRHLQFNLQSLDQGYFDAIITDPPYGIRAGARKTGRKFGCDYILTDEQRANHIPRKSLT